MVSIGGEKIVEKDFKQIVKEYVIITIGLILVAISIHVFMVPNNFVTGGVSGLAIVLRNALSTIPKSYQKVSIFGLNINLSFSLVYQVLCLFLTQYFIY